MTTLNGVNGTVCNAQQYQQFQQPYDNNSPSITCLTRGQSIGLALAVEASFISSISVVIIFIWIGWNVRWYRKKFPNGNWGLFRGPADIYMFSIFVFDFLQAIGGILNIRWAHNGIVTTGHYCTAQGLIEQIGDLGVAFITLFLAVHTFVAAVWEVGLKAHGVAVAVGLVCFACVFITLWVAIGAGIHKNYETPTPYWCWISPQFPGERLGGEYIWMWIALGASVMLYIPLSRYFYFWAKGFWSVDEENKSHRSNPDQRVEYTQKRAALGTLLYPLAYSIVVLPLSAARWSQFSHHHVPSAATLFGNSIFYLSGAINVLLFLIIRPELLLFPRPKELPEPQPVIDLGPQAQDIAPAILDNAANFQNSPEPTSMELGDEGARNSAAGSHVNPDEI